MNSDTPNASPRERVRDLFLFGSKQDWESFGPVLAKEVKDSLIESCLRQLLADECEKHGFEKTWFVFTTRIRARLEEYSLLKKPSLDKMDEILENGIDVAFNCKTGMVGWFHKTFDSPRARRKRISALTGAIVGKYVGESLVGTIEKTIEKRSPEIAVITVGELKTRFERINKTSKHEMEKAAREELQTFYALVHSCQQDLIKELSGVIAGEIGMFSLQGIDLGDIAKELIENSTKDLVAILRTTGEVLLESKIKEWAE